MIAQSCLINVDDVDDVDDIDDVDDVDVNYDDSGKAPCKW